MVKKKKKIKLLVAQPTPSNLTSPFYDLEKKHNIKITFHPFLLIEGETVKNIRLKKLHIPSYTAIILTSRNAVNHYFRICDEMRINVPNSLKYFCISEAVSYYLQKYIAYRKRKIYSAQNNFDELVELMRKHDNDRFMLVTSNFIKEEIITKLDSSGINYNRAPLFKTVSADLSKIKLASFDIIGLYSPRDVESIYSNFPNFQQDDIKIAAFGEATQKKAINSGLKLAIQAPSKEHPSMSMAIASYLHSL